MSTASAQDPPKTKDGWIAWAKDLKCEDWTIWPSCQRELHGIINAVIWDKRTKTVDITQQRPYLAILTHLADDNVGRSRPPNELDCEATRIMNGGQLPTIIRDRLQEAGWDPDLCNLRYHSGSKRFEQNASVNTNDDRSSFRLPLPRVLPDEPSGQDQQHIAEGFQMTQIQQSPVKDETQTHNQPNIDQPAAQTDPNHVPQRQLELASKKKRSRREKDSAPKELTPWMEWAKRQQNPAFADAPEREELEDTLEAVSWHSNGHPMPYKNQQPFIHLRGRWGPDGEREVDEVPSVINLEATRIMNKRKLPKEIYEWLANAGWDAKKCCNPKLSVLEKKLSVDHLKAMQQQEPASQETDEKSHQDIGEHLEAPKWQSYSFYKDAFSIVRNKNKHARSPPCPAYSMLTVIRTTRRWKTWARSKRKMSFLQYPDEDARLRSNIENVKWNARRSKPIQLHAQAPYISLRSQWKDCRLVSDSIVPSAADCEAVYLMHKLRFPTNLKTILAHAGWDAIKCCDPSLPVAERRLQPRLEESSKHSLAEVLADSAPPPKRQRSDMLHSELSGDESPQSTTFTPRIRPESSVPGGKSNSGTSDLSLFPRLSSVFHGQELARHSSFLPSTNNSQTNLTSSLAQLPINPGFFDNYEDTVDSELIWNSRPPIEAFPTIQTPKDTSTPQTAIMPSTPVSSKSTGTDKFGSAFLNDQMAKMADISAAFARHAQERDNAQRQQKDDLRRAVEAVEKSSKNIRQARKNLDSAHNQHDLDIAMLKRLVSPDEEHGQPV